MDVKTAVVEFLKNERNWITRESLIESLVCLGSHSGGVWPRMQADQIANAIAELIASNEILESPHGLRWKNYFFVEPAVTVKKPAKQVRGNKVVNDEQGMLF